MKQIFELREIKRTVREKYWLNSNIPNYIILNIPIKSHLVKRVWEYLDRKFGTVYHLPTLNLQKILNLSKLLLKTGTVLTASV